MTRRALEGAGIKLPGNGRQLNPRNFQNRRHGGPRYPLEPGSIARFTATAHG
jgi:hypothetical protein